MSSNDHVYYMVVGKTDIDWVLCEYLLEKDKRILEHFYFNSKENDKPKTELEVMVILFQRIAEIAKYLMMSYSERDIPKLKDLVLNGYNESNYKGGLKLRKLGNPVNPVDKVEKAETSEDPVEPAKKEKNKKEMTKKKKKPSKIGLRKSKPAKNTEKKKPAKNTQKKKPAMKSDKKKPAISQRKSKRVKKTGKKKSAKK